MEAATERIRRDAVVANYDQSVALARERGFDTFAVHFARPWVTRWQRGEPLQTETPALVPGFAWKPGLAVRPDHVVAQLLGRRVLVLYLIGFASVSINCVREATRRGSASTELELAPE